MTATHPFVDEHELQFNAMPALQQRRVRHRCAGPCLVTGRAGADGGAHRGEEYYMFAGRLDDENLSLGERIVTRAVHAPEGDFRDGGAIRA